MNNNIVSENIGSAKDNMRCAIHNWYKFTAGFSYKFVDIILANYLGKDYCVYEPFAGCGTTLVEAQKLGVSSVGNESQQIMCDIINAKLNWDIDSVLCTQYQQDIYHYVQINQQNNYAVQYNDLLVSLYDEQTLKTLYLLRDGIRNIPDETYRTFFNLALSRTLHKAAIHPIAVPYISRSKYVQDSGHAMEKFSTFVAQMLIDLETLPHRQRLAQVFRHDSRKLNQQILENSCDLCITSPPYLNNLDYGEVSKVHSHFFGYTNTWSDVTAKIRKDLVTGATTHYKDCDFNLEQFKQTQFAHDNTQIFPQLLSLYEDILLNGKNRRGGKSFHILMMHYFEDMYHVMLEMRRVLKPNSVAYLILGDSAPYGVYVPTTKLLGEIALSAGFNQYAIYKIRARGNKWKSLKNRHNIELSENILELK